MNTRKTALLLLLAAKEAQAATCTFLPELQDIITQLQTIGGPIALIMMIYMGMKWFMAEGPEDRENARRGIIYIIIGVILLAATLPLVMYLLCWTP